MPPYVVLGFIVKLKAVSVQGGVIQGPQGVAGGSYQSFVIGDGVLTSFTLVHGMNTEVTATVRRSAAPKDEITCDVEYTDLNTVTIRTFPVVPAVGELTVIVRAAGQAATLNITMDPWHAVGAPGEPAFQNGWVNYGGTEATAGFRKFPDGKVRLKGLIKSGVAGTAFVLPVGYRPAATVYMPISTGVPGTTYGNVSVDSAGNVSVSQAAANWTSLSSIEFDTESVLQTASVAAQPLDTVHVVGAAGEPPFANGWVNFDAPSSTARRATFRKDVNGKVRLSGVVKSGAMGSRAFTLPAGYRPVTSEQDFVVNSNGLFGTVVVFSDGAVTPVVGSTTYVFLDGVEFDTESVAAYASGIIGPPKVTALPANPVDGQECYYVADATNGVLWHLRFNAASASAYKWEFVGGSDLFASETATHNPLSSTVLIDKNGGPVLSVPLKGDYDLTFTGEIYTNPNNYCYVVITDAANVGLSNYLYAGNFSGFGVSSQQSNRVTLAAPTSIKARVFVGGGSGYVQGVRMWVRPVRVG